MSRRSRRAALAAVIVAAGAACRGAATPPPAARPDVLLLTLDGLRADQIGSSPPVATQLDALAREGVAFDRAYTQAPLCLPGHATILTGASPARHGLHDDGRGVIADGVRTLAESFRDAGYQTAAFVSSTALDRRYGLDRGFDVYADDLGPAGKAPDSIERSVASEPIARARAWLSGATPGRPVFVWVHLDDPRPPHTPSAEMAKRFPDSPYAAEVAGMDAEIGALLSDLRGGRKAWLAAAVADHGTGLGEHGEDGNGRLLYSATTRVPMAIAYAARLPAGRRVAPPVRVMDLAPTLADLAGVVPPATAEGQSLARLMRGETADGPPPARIETFAPWYRYGFAPLRGVRSGPYLFVRGPGRELYDADQDPNESDESSARLPKVAADLEALVDAAPSGAPAGGDSAREQDLYRRYREAAAADGRGEAAPARRGYESILSEAPGFVAARARLAALLLREGRLAESRAAMEALIRRGEATDATYLDLALVHHRARRPDDAVRVLREGVGAFPRSASLRHRLGRVLLARGDAAGAAAALQESLRLEPRFLDAQIALAEALRAEGRRDEAEAVVGRLRAMAPDSEEAKEASRIATQ